MRFRLATLLIVVFLAALGMPILDNYLNNRQLWLEDYNRAALDRHLSNGRCVLVTIHADWDAVTMDQLTRMTSNVPRAIRHNDMAAMSANWTTKSASVDRLMTRLGLQAVPAFAIFTPDDSPPIVLPDLTSEADLLAIIDHVHQQRTDRTTR